MDFKLIIVILPLVLGQQLSHSPEILIDPAPSNAIQEQPPPCPGLFCTLEFIPVACRDIPIITQNGVACSGCATWKSSCKNDNLVDKQAPIVKPEVNKPQIACPLLQCPRLDIPEKCKFIETYDSFGRQCVKCPVPLLGCMHPNGRPIDQVSTAAPEVSCPVLDCDLRFIPTECMQIPTFIYKGKQCNSCPVWRQGCNPLNGQQQQFALNEGSVPEIACPLVVCDTDVPMECSVSEELKFQNKICQGCPSWRQGCREQERVLSMNGRSINYKAFTPTMACPLLACASLNIPVHCIIESSYEFRGTVCKRCPTVRPNCQPNNNNGMQLDARRPRIACPIIQCQPLNVPNQCQQDEVFQFQGQTCTGCPTVRSDCRGIVSSGSIPIPEISCPMLRCELLYIPKECEVINTFQFQGKECQACPTYREGCLSMQLNVGRVPKLANGFPQIPKVLVDNSQVTCPVVGCPMVYIPDNCRLEQPYQFKGKTCYRCPVWKETCTLPGAPPNGVINNEPIIPCPLTACTRIYIPDECRETPTYQFRGQTCKLCPKFRDGCVPTLDQTSSFPTNGISNNEPQVSCPLNKCPRIYIPSECKEIPTYQLRGQTCTLCPKFRDGCVPNLDQTSSSPTNGIVNNEPQVACPLVACTRIYIPAECREIPTYQFRGQTCTLCPKFRDGCVQKGGSSPQDLGLTNNNAPIVVDGSPIDAVVPSNPLPTQDTSCPPMKCNRMFVPPECADRKKLDIGGKSCYTCPTWRDGCVPSGRNNNNEIPEVACPLLKCQYVPNECKVKTTIMSFGKMCPSCPKWREGCKENTGAQSAEENTANDKSPRVSCPLLRCEYVPTECKVKTTFKSRGKTCTGCPNWKPGCQEDKKPRILETKIQTDAPKIAVSETVKTNTATIKPISSNTKLSDLKEIIPVSRFISAVNDVSCPPLPCPAMEIPFQCQVYSTYYYRGRSCRGCPTWRAGCGTTSTGLNMNGLLAFNLFNQLLVK